MITLEQISKDEHGGHSGWNDDSRRDAAALFNTCSDFGFIVTLVVVQNVCSYTHAATVKLQRSQGDILKTLASLSHLSWYRMFFHIHMQPR